MAWIEGILMMCEYLVWKIFRNLIKDQKGGRLAYRKERRR